jgi:hypothetical protein
MSTKKENPNTEAPEDISLEHIKGCVNKVLSEFTSQEMGNKVSQFNMQGLANILIGVIMNPNSLKEPEKPNQQPKA